ncbi:hypothetical protein [uncultured Parabacteroides sp.]|uniref:hypothetical protein n=1 Tax=uncultured Parabacteroides sp. TaxID=512312 RepID=UPI002624970D|nr:hypothetical protein [uncultured Parabacteroides sp.]
MTHRYSYLAIYLWLTVSLCLSCSQETKIGTTDDGLCTLNIVIKAKASEDEQQEQDATPYEYMSDIMLFIVNEKNNNQKGVIEFAAYQKFDEENVKEAIITTDKQIPTGNKKIYIFSNFNTFTEKQDKELFKELQDACQNYINGSSFEFPFTAEEMSQKTVTRLPEGLVYTKEKDGKYMPMSYVYTFTAQKGLQEIGPLPLIRMFAKIKVSVTNKTEEEISFKNWKIEAFRNDTTLFLLPYPGLDEETVDESLQPQLPTEDEKIQPLELSKSETKVSVNKTVESIIYVKEGFSTSDRESTIPYVVTLTPTTGTLKDKTLHGHSQYTYIRRNDYMILPLILKDGRLFLTLTSLKAPIGGLPQTTFNQIDISDQYYCEVSDKDGLFYIEMELFYKTENEPVKLEKKQIELEIEPEGTKILGTLPDSSTGERLRFNPAPEGKKSSGYIEGLFSGENGNVTIKLTLTLDTDDIRTYNIHITKK